MPERIQLRRTRGWRKPASAVVVARPTRWGNPFRHHDPITGLVRVPGVLTGGAWEFEGRISSDGNRHDYWHPNGRRDVVHVRWATHAELVELYRRALVRQEDAAFRAAWGATGWPDVPTAEQARAELAGHDLACWCPLGQPCHADVLLKIANPDLEKNPPHGRNETTPPGL